MVVEHAFITVLESTEAMKRAADYLSSRGFTLVPGIGAAFALGAQSQAWTLLEMHRGKKRAARAKNVSQLPQKVRIEWDRGRVSVALSIAANTAWGGGSAFALSSHVEEKPKKMKLHIKLLSAIANGLEKLLAYNGPGQADYSEWDIVEKEILAVARRRTIRNVIIFLLVMSVFAALVTLAVVYGSRRGI